MDHQDKEDYSKLLGNNNTMAMMSKKEKMELINEYQKSTYPEKGYNGVCYQCEHIGYIGNHCRYCMEGYYIEWGWNKDEHRGPDELKQTVVINKQEQNLGSLSAIVTTAAGEKLNKDTEK